MKIGVLGAFGNIGKVVAEDLLADEAITEVWQYDIVSLPISGGRLKYTNNMQKIMATCDGVVNCMPYLEGASATADAIAYECNMVDLGGNVGVVQAQLALNDEAEKADVLIVPDVGLAPGLVSVLTAALVDELGEPDYIRLRVGGLPQNPEGSLNYSLTFSLDGLVNEYMDESVYLDDGRIMTAPYLCSPERVHFKKMGAAKDLKHIANLTARTTSGATSTLPTTYQHVVGSLDYKTIRYDGHYNTILRMISLAEELGLDPRVFLKENLGKVLEPDPNDMVLLIAEGRKDNELITYEMIHYSNDKHTAMQETTAYPAVAVIKAICSGEVDARGVMTQEHFIEPTYVLNYLADRGIVINKIGEKAKVETNNAT